MDHTSISDEIYKTMNEHENHLAGEQDKTKCKVEQNSASPASAVISELTSTTTTTTTIDSLSAPTMSSTRSESSEGNYLPLDSLDGWSDSPKTPDVLSDDLVLPPTSPLLTSAAINTATTCRVEDAMLSSVTSRGSTLDRPSLSPDMKSPIVDIQVTSPSLTPNNENPEETEQSPENIFETQSDMGSTLVLDADETEPEDLSSDQMEEAEDAAVDQISVSTQDTTHPSHVILDSSTPVIATNSSNSVPATSSSCDGECGLISVTDEPNSGSVSTEVDTEPCDLTLSPAKRACPSSSLDDSDLKTTESSSSTWHKALTTDSYHPVQQTKRSQDMSTMSSHGRVQPNKIARLAPMQKQSKTDENPCSEYSNMNDTITFFRSILDGRDIDADNCEDVLESVKLRLDQYAIKLQTGMSLLRLRECEHNLLLKKIEHEKRELAKAKEKYRQLLLEQENTIGVTDYSFKRNHEKPDSVPKEDGVIEAEENEEIKHGNCDSIDGVIDTQPFDDSLQAQPAVDARFGKSLPAICANNGAQDYSIGRRKDATFGNRGGNPHRLTKLSPNGNDVAPESCHLDACSATSRVGEYMTRNEHDKHNAIDYRNQMQRSAIDNSSPRELNGKSFPTKRRYENNSGSQPPFALYMPVKCPKTSAAVGHVVETDNGNNPDYCSYTRVKDNRIQQRMTSNMSLKANPGISHQNQVNYPQPHIDQRARHHTHHHDTYTANAMTPQSPYKGPYNIHNPRYDRPFYENNRGVAYGLRSDVATGPPRLDAPPTLYKPTPVRATPSSAYPWQARSTLPKYGAGTNSSQVPITDNASRYYQRFPLRSEPKTSSSNPAVPYTANDTNLQDNCPPKLLINPLMVVPHHYQVTQPVHKACLGENRRYQGNGPNTGNDFSTSQRLPESSGPSPHQQLQGQDSSQHRNYGEDLSQQAYSGGHVADNHAKSHFTPKVPKITKVSVGNTSYFTPAVSDDPEEIREWLSHYQKSSSESDNGDLSRYQASLLSGPLSRCHACGKPAKFLCSRCKQLAYCGRSCQVQEWKNHKVSCHADSASPSP